LGTFPERVLGAVNAGLTAIVDLGLAPAIRIAPLATLFVISVVTGVAMLWVIGRTSNQAGIARAKRGIQAALFEIRLFNDNLGAVLVALGRVLAHNARYLAYSLVPLAWAAVPLILVVAQLQAFYGYDGIATGAPALVTATLRDPSATAAASTASLLAPPQIRVETAAVVLPGSGEVIWRIVPSSPGAFNLRAIIAGHELTKTVQVGGAAARRSPFRVSGVLDQLLYPSEPVLPRETSLTRITVPYPEPGIEVLGWRVHWMIVYIAVSMAAAFALAKRMGVTL
jgi:uncharacterized membrane protein (DUF106 family)